MSSNPVPTPEPAGGRKGVKPVYLTAVPGGATEKARGYADGYSHGWAAGSQAAAEQALRDNNIRVAESARDRAVLTSRVERALEVLALASEAARARTAPVLSEAQEVMMAGVVELAAAVLAIELSDHAAAVRSALIRALRMEGPDRVVRVRLNPGDLDALRQGGDALLGSLRLPDDVELVADPSLAPGDAMSELPEGMLDARISLAMARVREELGLTGGEPR